MGRENPQTKRFLVQFKKMHTLWSIYSQENWCHQMSDFKAKMHQIRFPLGSDPDPVRGAYSAPPGPLAVFKEPTSNGREGKGKEGRAVRRAPFRVGIEGLIRHCQDCVAPYVDIILHRRRF